MVICRIINDVAALQYNAICLRPAINTAAARCLVARDRTASHVELAAASFITFVQNSSCNAATHTVGGIVSDRSVFHIERSVMLYKYAATASIRLVDATVLNPCSVPRNRSTGHFKFSVLPNQNTTAAVCTVVRNRSTCHGKGRSIVYQHTTSGIKLSCRVSIDRTAAHGHRATIRQQNTARILIAKCTPGNDATIHIEGATRHFNCASIGRRSFYTRYFSFLQGQCPLNLRKHVIIQPLTLIGNITIQN